MKLYEISQNYQNLRDLLEDETVPNDVVLDALKEIDGVFEEKADNIIKLVKMVEGECELFRSEEIRLADKRRSAEKKVNDLKEYLKSNMILLDKKKIDTPLFKLTVQKNPVSVEVMDINQVPEQYLIYKMEAAKKDILKAHKEGLHIPGVSINQSESLRIK